MSEDVEVEVGATVGAVVGPAVGATVGEAVGEMVGDAEGVAVGAAVMAASAIKKRPAQFHGFTSKHAPGKEGNTGGENQESSKEKVDVRAHW